MPRLREPRRKECAQRARADDENVIHMSLVAAT